MRLWHEENGKQEATQRDTRKQPLHRMDATQQRQHRSIALDGEEHQNVGHRVRDGVRNASDGGGKQLSGHRPRYRQQAEHREGDEKQQAHHGDPSVLGSSGFDPNSKLARDEHANGHSEGRDHD